VRFAARFSTSEGDADADENASKGSESNRAPSSFCSRQNARLEHREDSDGVGTGFVTPTRSCRVVGCLFCHPHTNSDRRQHLADHCLGSCRHVGKIEAALKIGGETGDNLPRVVV
jgi:hypothetical protein